MNIIADDRLGYYRVGSEKFYSKIDACIHASRVGQHPDWCFNDHVWRQQNWRHEPEIDILELYKMRARQIRERYDYVILNYSGGSDSQTMMDAFLKSGSHIDEVVTIWNRSHISYVDNSGSTFVAENVEAEFDLATRPGLDRLIAASPTTKITYIDVSKHIVDAFNQIDGEEWLQTTPEHLNPQLITRWSLARDKSQLLQLDQGKKTVSVFAIDKPRICIKDGRYCLYFLDLIINMVRGGRNRPGYDNAQVELFYWTPELPEIVIKQAHMIMNWFKSHPKLESILAWPNHDFSKRTALEILTRSIIYPEWNMNTFQCNKPTSAVWSEWDSWFFSQYRETNSFHQWLKGVNFVQSNIDKKYLNYNFHGRFEGFVGMINGHFALDSPLT